jgi:hypothetical protein
MKPNIRPHVMPMNSRGARLLLLVRRYFLPICFESPTAGHSSWAGGQVMWLMNSSETYVIEKRTYWLDNNIIIVIIDTRYSNNNYYYYYYLWAGG